LHVSGPFGDIVRRFLGGSRADKSRLALLPNAQFKALTYHFC